MKNTYDWGTRGGIAQNILVIVVIAGIIVGSVFVFGSSFGFNDSPDPKTPVETEQLATQTIGQTPTSERTETAVIEDQTTVLPPTPTPTPSQKQTVESPSSTPTDYQSTTQTRTDNPFANEKYHDFVSIVFGEAEVDADVPLRMRSWQVGQGNVLIIVMNLTSESKNDVRRAREVNTLVTSGYAQAVAHYDNGRVDGKIPDRLRIAEVNETVTSPKTLYVNTSLVREYYTGQINAMEFTEQYWETERNMTADEEAFVRDMDRGTENVTLYNESAK